LVTNPEQYGNSKDRSARVNLTFNDAQIKVIDSLIGEIGDSRADVVKVVFLSWLSEKGVTPGLIKKRLGLK
jgi:hypothetical protein